MSQPNDFCSQNSAGLTVGDVVRVMEDLAPPALSESWDNTGLLLGDPSDRVSRLMTCLTLTLESVQEAIELRTNIVIAHHPLPFKPLSRITTESIAGKLLWELAKAKISVYSPHTSWDSAAEGINYQLAKRLDLHNIAPLIIPDDDSTKYNPHAQRDAGDQRDASVAVTFATQANSSIGAAGSGRFGHLAIPSNLTSIARTIAVRIPNCRLRGVESGREIQSVAFACGSGGSFLSAAVKHKCQLLVTGEATFHTCLEAKALGVSLLLIGHFASEKFAMNRLAEILRSKLSGVEIWSCQRESDPIKAID